MENYISVELEEAARFIWRKIIKFLFQNLLLKYFYISST